MTFEQFIGLILVALMMGIVFLATQFVSSASHNGKNLWFITVRSLIYRDLRYIPWLKDNTVYWWCVLLIISLIIIILALIPPFRQGSVYVRPEIALVSSIPLWISILYTYKWFFKKLGKI